MAFVELAQLVLILAVIVLFVFGASRLPSLGDGVGQMTGRRGRAAGAPIERDGSSAGWFRGTHLFGEAAFIGNAAALGLVIVYRIAQHWHLASLPLWERAFLALVGSWTRILGVGIFFAEDPRRLLILVVPAALAARRTTRPAALALLGAVLELHAAWLAAFLHAICHAADHRLGALVAVLAFPAALALSRPRRWPMESMVVLAGGFLAGLPVALVFPPDDEARVMRSALLRFTPFLVGSIVVALVLARLSPFRSRPSPRRNTESWGLTAVCLNVLALFGLFEVQVERARVASPAQSIAVWGAYDLTLTGSPPQLVWTDKQHVHAMTRPYGETHERSVLDGGVRYPQRIWPAADGGFYVQAMLSVEGWPAPSGDGPIRSAPTLHFPRPASATSGPPWAFAEDPIRDRVFYMTEWHSAYVVADRTTGAITAHGRMSSALWPGFHGTVDARGRVLYLSSCMEDGGLYVVNLDSLEVTRRVPGLYLYETTLDADGHTLWGARPLLGEVVGVDTRTLQVTRRIPVQFGVRDVKRDPRTGDLYACSFIAGEVFRVDPTAGTATLIGRCGRLCRNLFLDSENRTLWVASRDRICRFPLRNDGAAAGGWTTRAPLE